MVDQGTEVADVRPDHQTKVVGSALYAMSMGLICFLSLQVWMLNGKMERITAQGEAQGAAQQRFNSRIERSLERLNDKVDNLVADENHSPD